MATSLTSRSQFSESHVFVIPAEPQGRVSLRSAARPMKVLRPPVASPPPAQGRQVSGVSMAVVALVLALVWALWEGHKARAEAQEAQSSAAFSWAFADGVLDDLKSLRDDASRLDADRKGLIQQLDKTEQQSRSLKGEVGTWQQRHQQLETETQRAFNQWSAYGARLEGDLGDARTRLTQSSTVIEQERAAAEQERTNAQQQLNQLGDENSALAQAKQSIEREADALDRKAASLSNDNRFLQNEISSLNNEAARLRNCISALENDKSNLLACNANLSTDNHRLKCEVGELRRRIDCLENELNRAKNDNSNSGSGSGSNFGSGGGGRSRR